jgi:hypothetical protein
MHRKKVKVKNTLEKRRHEMLGKEMQVFEEAQGKIGEL